MANADEKAPQRVLILGCGALGTEIAALLLAMGCHLTGLRRHPPHNSLPGLHFLGSDINLLTPGSLPAAEQIIFCPTPDLRTAPAYIQTYWSGLKRCLAALSTAYQHLWVISSTSIYGNQQGDLDETTSIAPANALQEALAQMEFTALSQPKGTATVLRLSGLYGGQRHHLLEQIAQGLVPDITADANALWSNRIHLQDAARLLAHLISMNIQGQPIAPLYLGTDQKPTTPHELVDWLRQKMGITHRDPHRTLAIGSKKRLHAPRLAKIGFHYRYPTYQEGYTEILSRWSQNSH